MLPIINERIRYTSSMKKYIKKQKPLTGGEWVIQDKGMKLLKRQIRCQLIKIQDSKCAYCGLQLDETCRGEIEHIAPKGGEKRPKYTQFTFTPYNLVLSCHLCNGPIKKGTKDTIVSLNINYKLCEFNIFHPYFDNPSDHFDWIANGVNVLIQHKTEKGKKSIEIFGLDNNAHLEARGKAVLHSFFKNSNEEEAEKFITNVLEYKKGED